MMIHQELLRRAVAGHHPMIQHFVETLAPHVLLAFSRIPALGGSGAALPGERDPLLPPEAVAYDPEVRARFSQTNPDQSLSAHLFNGIFAGARVAKSLPPSKQLNDLEWQVWILGFIVHDYTKIHGIEIAPRYMAQIESIIEQQGERLNFAAFLPTWRDYLDDIAFLAQNTQKVKDAAMNWSLYPKLQLDQRRLLTLRYLSSFADILVHITRPADVAERDSRGRDTAQNLRATLGMLFGTQRPPRLAYHQLTEVRGLLSNLINNSLMHALEPQGYQPYLFFPDGVVYLVPDQQQASLDQQELLDTLWREVGATLAGLGQEQSTEAEVSEDENPDLEGGLRIARTKDYMKVPPVLYELLNPTMLLLAARQAALRVRAALTAERLGAEVADQQGIATSRMPAKEKKALFERLGHEALQQEGLPGDVRVDQLAEYLGFIWRRMLRFWFPKASWPTSLLLELLELHETITPERAEAGRSGTPTGWFYVAARYIQREQLDPEQLEERMHELGNRVLRYLAEHKLVPPEVGRFETAFRDYVQANITIDGTMLSPLAELEARFVRELTQYSERKATNKVQCSLCSSPYEARQQDKSEVLFKPQQYSNKTRLDTSTVVRGICPICAIELMLRQVQQGMRAGSAQDEKPITLWLYPTYFFTAETSRVVHDFIAYLRDLNLPGLIFSHLERHGFTLEALASYETFVNMSEDTMLGTTWTIRAPAFSKRDAASLFFFTLRPAMSKPSDTDAWIVPTFYALALPLLLDIQVVTSASFVPIYGSGAEFRGTSVLDAPHSFTRYILDGDELRLDQLETQLWRLLRLYQLHLDVFAEPKDLNWGMLNGVAKDIATDPLAVFSYYERKQRTKSSESQQDKPKKGKAKAKSQPKQESGDTIAPYMIERYMAIYQTLRRNDVTEFIAQLVDDYAAFYRADYRHLGSAYTVLRPLGTAIDVTKRSSPNTAEEDLILLIAGAINDEMDRVRNDAATSGGFDPIITDKSRGTYPERLDLSMQAIAHFARQFVQRCFKEYCKGDRGILRERANRIRSAANFHYLATYARFNTTAQADATTTQE
ncbi:type I-D CRISPR-associated protein Cas10d/Csc3 [Candidatus Viridilinea mediisalina]|uniref:Type I-D CRISPR-associated protein Cas10d/Csc3 n=1 Tax=Candidatus Viridilinea mediisalina TaxID=2024553 RepID=A0A2A6REQ9_9CHLR|nr:type I-D CRISPR-associated protein Cas10d/Csc3 [Candidatus Viridilinea mediisalina]PDW01379.1 hypothetical protein CJ255_19215 [Candidatus Viridilinea mediisalina]